MDIPTELLTLFSGQINQHDGRFVIEVPRGEVDLGIVQPGETYRVAIPPERVGGQSTNDTGAESGRATENAGPPVNEGERRTVEIENIGEQGDGIARVERGFVIIVSDTSIGEVVTVEIATVRENVAFADVVERPDDYE